MEKIINFFEGAFLKSAFSKEMVLTFFIYYYYVWGCEIKKSDEKALLQLINDLVE